VKFLRFPSTTALQRLVKLVVVLCHVLPSRAGGVVPPRLLRGYGGRIACPARRRKRRNFHGCDQTLSATWRARTRACACVSALAFAIVRCCFPNRRRRSRGRSLFLAFRRSDDIDDIDYPPPQGAPSAFGLPCTLRRSGNLVHPPPSAFRARVVDVVGIVDVVDRPRPLRAAPKAAPGLRAGSRSLARISRRILWKYFIYNWKYFIYNHDISRVEFGVFPGRSRAGLGPWIRRGSGREGGAKPQREDRGRRAERATPRCARGHESPAPGARPCRMARLVRRTSRLQR